MNLTYVVILQLAESNYGHDFQLYLLLLISIKDNGLPEDHSNRSLVL